jgi:hypothetical protein
MANIAKFLQGKKTYISAAALALAAILGWWFGAINDANALALLSLAGAAAGLGAKSQRNAELMMAALGSVRAAQAGHTSVIKALQGQVVKHQADLVKLAEKVAPGADISAGRVIVPAPVPSPLAIREAEESGASQSK